jgi:hypothetical protein
MMSGVLAWYPPRAVERKLHTEFEDDAIQADWGIDGRHRVDGSDRRTATDAREAIEATRGPRA